MREREREREREKVGREEDNKDLKMGRCCGEI